MKRLGETILVHLEKMSTKNRLIQSFITLVPDYVRTKCERHESEIQRCLQVMCCIENLSLFDTSQGNITEFFINVRELLRTCDNKSNLGWKGIDLVKHLSSNSSICQLLCQLQFVPVLSQYLQGQLESEKAVLLLSLLETLTDGIIIDRSGYWLSNSLKYLTNAILEKSDYTLPHLLAVLSNLCFENYVVVNELQRANRSEDLLQFLVQLQTNNPLVQLHASQVFFSCLASGSINEAMLSNYLTTVLDMLPIGFKNNNIKLIKRGCCILLWMTRDRLILDLLKASHFQKLLQSCIEGLVTLLTPSQHTSAVNCILFFTTQLLRTQLIVDKKFTEAFIPALIPLLKNAALNEHLLELLADLINITPNLSLNEQSFECLVVNQLNDFKNPTCKKSCTILGYSLQILKKLYKMQPSNNRIAMILEPETFVKIVSMFTDFGEEVDQKNADLSLAANPPVVSRFTFESRIIVVQCLTIFGDIAFRERDQLPIYSDLLAKPNVQQCLAAAIVLSDCQIKQDALALIGTVGFNRESLAGLSHAMDQLYSRRGSSTDDKEQLVNRSILNVTMSPEQIKKLDKIAQNMQQDKFWETMKQCDVVELMELQIARREREELRLLHDLDSYKQEVDSLKINIMQIGAENERMMAMLLSKTQLIESKESENRGLTRRLEKMNETQRSNKLDWTKERDRLLREKNKFEAAQTEITNQIQSQLDAALKQNRNHLQTIEDLQEELKKSQKSFDVLKLTCEKKSKELDKLSQEFQEIKINSDNLGKTLRKKETENEEKDREINSLNQAMKKSEMVREDLEVRLNESEKTCQETKKKLTKLEKIQEFIYDLSSGKNKLFEDPGK